MTSASNMRNKVWCRYCNVRGSTNVSGVLVYVALVFIKRLECT